MVYIDDDMQVFNVEAKTNEESLDKTWKALHSIFEQAKRKKEVHYICVEEGQYKHMRTILREFVRREHKSNLLKYVKIQEEVTI